MDTITKDTPTSRVKKQKSGILVVLVFAFFIIYIPSLFIWLFGRNVKTDFLRQSYYEDAINAEAIIVRDEEIISAPISGKCIFKMGEGEKVPASSQIATIYQESAGETIKKIQQLDENILQAQKSKTENDRLFNDDIRKLDEIIFQKVKKMNSYAEQKNYFRIEGVRNEIDEVIRKKAAITGNLSTSDTYIQSLVKQREDLQSKVNTSRKDVFNTLPGVVSYSMDGLENVLNVKSIPKLTAAFLENLKIDQKNLTQQQNAQAGMPFAKIINNLEAYLVVVMDESKSSNLTVDDDVKIRFNDLAGKIIVGAIDYMTHDEGGKIIASIKINKGIDETTKMRQLNIDIIKDSKSGYRVPLTALKDIGRDAQGQLTGILMLVKFNYTEPRSVKISMMSNEYAIIEEQEEFTVNGISIYDEYIINTEKVPEGRRMR